MVHNKTHRYITRKDSRWAHTFSKLDPWISHWDVDGRYCTCNLSVNIHSSLNIPTQASDNYWHYWQEHPVTICFLPCRSTQGKTKKKLICLLATLLPLLTQQHTTQDYIHVAPHVSAVSIVRVKKNTPLREQKCSRTILLHCPLTNETYYRRIKSQWLASSYQKTLVTSC